MSEYNPQYPQQQDQQYFEKPAQSKVAMILISFLIGSLGIHRYLMGYKTGG